MSAAKISIAGQIAEVKRELALRENVYPRQVASGKMKQGEAELLTGRMEAVLATLMFVQEHETGYRAYIAAKKAGAA